METKNFILPAFLSLFLTFIHSFVLAQSPLPAPVSSPPAPVLPPPAPGPPLVVVAPAPGPVPPPNIVAILKKAGRFSILLRLIKNTQAAARINTQLSASTGGGLTILAPNDGAFSGLSLNTYSAQQQTELVQFHTLPSYMSIPQFQTASNPMSTEAGGSNYGEFPLNITSSASGINITSGFSNSSIVGTVYSDGRLAVYEVNRVLLPQRFFISPPPPPPMPQPSPAPSLKPKRSDPVLASRVPSHAGRVRLNLMDQMFHGSLLVGVLAASRFYGCG